MKNLFKILVTLTAVVYAAVVYAGTMYKWVGKDGKISYHDTPPSSDDYRVEEKNFDSRIKPDPTSAANTSPVVLYSAPKCATCDLARAYLEKRKIPYSEKNVERDVKLQEELKAKTDGALMVPTITVGAKVMQGYLESLLAGELDSAGYSKRGGSVVKPEKSGEEKPREEKPGVEK